MTFSNRFAFPSPSAGSVVTATSTSARPPFALDRIEALPDGRVSYLLKVPRRGRSHRVMSPMDFMAWLAPLIPPPRIPLVRYHGVFAPRSSWRELVTPKPPPEKAVKPKPCVEHASGPPASPAPAPASAPAPVLVSPAPALPCVLLSPSVSSPAPAEPVVRVEPTTMTVEHWGRLREEELFATSRIIEWAVLMRPTWGLDVLACPRCARKMRVRSTITDRATIRRILKHLCVRADPLPRAPAQDPTGAQVDFGFDADADAA
ncbi:transposase [Sorangium sp. So ce1128]